MDWYFLFPKPNCFYLSWQKLSRLIKESAWFGKRPRILKTRKYNSTLLRWIIKNCKSGWKRWYYQFYCLNEWRICYCLGYIYNSHSCNIVFRVCQINSLLQSWHIYGKNYKTKLQCLIWINIFQCLLFRFDFYVFFVLLFHRKWSWRSSRHKPWGWQWLWKNIKPCGIFSLFIQNFNRWFRSTERISMGQLNC